MLYYVSFDITNCIWIKKVISHIEALAHSESIWYLRCDNNNNFNIYVYYCNWTKEVIVLFGIWVRK